MKLKYVILGLALLCVESALIDDIMDRQEKENARRDVWNAVLIKEIDKLQEGQ